MCDPYRHGHHVQQRQFIVFVTSSSGYGARSSAASALDRDSRDDGIDGDGTGHALPEPSV